MENHEAVRRTLEMMKRPTRRDHADPAACTVLIALFAKSIGVVDQRFRVLT
jgi:hypothetical protein